MKKIFILVIATIFGWNSMNSQDLGKIIIRNASVNSPKFIASLNGIRLSNEYTSLTAFSMLDENAYRLKLLQAGSTSLLTFTLSSEPKYLSKYVITKDNVGNYSVILESKSLMLDDEPIVNVTTTQTTAVITPPITAVTTPSVPATTTIGIIPPPVNAVAITNISAAEFNERMGAVNREHFDDKRLAKAKQVFDDEILSTNQVITVVKSFSFDDSKVDFAKWAYSRTIDKKNYYKVEDQFSFGSSKTDLSNYTKSQPK